ncbi:MAG: oxidoreductase, partial [Candidatus Rokuibacteriota bacterium]
MQAIRVHEGGELRCEQVNDPVPAPGEVVVEIRAAALNRRDLLVRNPPGPAYEFPKPFVAGHDGAGVRRDTGEEVVIFPGVGWGQDDAVPEPGFRFLGGPLDGTFAKLV